MVLHLDRTLGASADARERTRVGPWVNKLKGATKFSEHELRCVLLMFNKLTRPERRYLLQPELFYCLRVQFEITERSMLSRIFSMMERPHSPGIGTEEWVRLLGLFLRGSLEEKIDFNWRIYDNTGQGMLTHDDVIALTVSHLGPYSTDEERNEFADDVLICFDKDGDGIISYADYKAAVLATPAELNTLGRACPEPHVVGAFLATFAPSKPLKAVTVTAKNKLNVKHYGVLCL